jgi:hypothetical protein
MAERQEGGFVFDPFEGTQLGALANEEEEQQPQEEETIQVSRPDDPYAVGPADPASQQPPVAEEDDSRLTITPDMIVTYPDSPYRTPDPYTADPEEGERLQEFFYTPRQEGMPKSRIDLEQDQQVTNAPFFITSGGVRVDFEADLPLTTKYRYMMANDGVAVPLSKEDGTLDMEGQDFLRYDLVPQKLYEQYTTPQVRAGAIENVGGFLGDVLVGPTGRGDMQEANAYLENLGLNQNARTYIMKGIATNEFELDSIIQGPADIAGFVLSLPAYAQKGVNFLMKDITLPFIGFLTGEDMTDARKQAAKMQESQILNYEIPSYSQYIANKYDMLPEVVEYAIQPQGAISRAGKFLAEDLPMYAGAAALRVGSALRRMNELDIFMKRNHGGENFLESLKNASEKGIDLVQIQQDFIAENVERIAADKINRDLDLAFGLAVMRPGSETRVQLLKPQVDALKKEEDAILKDIQVARSANNKKALKRAQTRYKSVQQQRRNIEGDLLLPKYLNDAAKELRGTTAWVVGATTTYGQFFGNDPSTTPLVEFGGVIGMLTMPKAGEKIKRFGKATLTELVASRHLLRLNPKAWQEERTQVNMSRGARNALDEIMSLPSELRESMLAGFEEAATIRRGLIELSEKTGVDINEDAFIENIATLSDVGALVTLSRNISEKVVVTDLGKLASEVQRSQQVLQSQQMLIANMAEATRKMLNLKITAELPDDDPISQLAIRMQAFVTSQADRLATDKEELANFIKSQGKNLEMMVMSHRVVKDGESTEGVSDAIQLMEMETRAANMGIDPKLIEETGLDPTEAMRQAAENITQLETKQADLVENLVNNLNKEQAASGDAGVVYTVAAAVRKNQISNKVESLYRSFDKDYPNVRANVGGIYDVMFSKEFQKELSDFMPEEVTTGALSLVGNRLYGQTNRGFASLFNGAAGNGLDLVRKRLGDRADDFDRLLGEMGVETASPIEQFTRLKTILDDTSEESADARTAALNFFGGDETAARKFMDTLPMLVTTADWRLVNKHLNMMIGKGGDNVGMYRALQSRWEAVGQKTIDDGTGNQVNNPMAFQVGWFGEQDPSNVAEEVYAKFREIQTFYRTEYAERYYYDPRVRKMNEALTKPRQDAALQASKDVEEIDQVDLNAVVPAFSQVSRELKPDNAFNYLYGNVLQSKVAYQGEHLYTNVIEPLAKQVGMYDPGTGRYRIVIESADPEDKEAVRVAKGAQKSVLRWLQGELVKTKGGRQVIQRDARGKPIFEPDQEYEFNRAGFDSFANVPVFRKNADGTFEEVGRLIDNEEAFNAITIDSLEMNRADLSEVFDEAYGMLDGTWKTEALGRLEGAGATVKADHDFVNEFMRVYGIQPQQGVTNIDMTAERVFQAVTSGTMMRPGASGEPNLFPSQTA